ncbi:RsiV family protein [Chryseobacterium fluminis]|uniref:RsiV family protein n=1 Tax=Chryseobacterium fluminis TaxID=2983606 RepID=UPI00224E8FD7|nr:RsiV family protein [Chryseobacterium sp. MMS21-Ot14]UZT97736.1 RsiV family protein [Chryseobacterium sp. MMS21-Ot14]
MKNTIAVVALFSVFAVSSCNKKKSDHLAANVTEVAQPEKFTLDSVVVKDSVMLTDSLKIKFSAQMLVFPTIKDKKLLDSIYYTSKDVRDFSKEGIKKLNEKEKNDYFISVKKDSKDWLPDIRYYQEWYSDTSMKMVSNVNDYMHIEYFWGSYEGGAHDNYGFAERVFDLKNKKKLQLDDITSMPKNKLEELLKNNINKQPGGTTDENGTVDNSDMLIVDKIPATGNFYFDQKNLYFHYSPYEITAFAAGDLLIPISWEELKGTLKPEFMERMKIK